MAPTLVWFVMSSSTATQPRFVHARRPRWAAAGRRKAPRAPRVSSKPVSFAQARRAARRTRASRARPARPSARSSMRSMSGCHGRQPLLFHKQRQIGSMPPSKRPLDHLLRLGDEQRTLRLQLTAQLSLGQPRERIEPWVFQCVYIDKGHAGSFQNKSARLL